MKLPKVLGCGLLLVTLIVFGCKQDTPKTTDTKKGADAPKSDASNKPADKKDAHTHGAGPNGGAVFDLGKFHAEFTVNHDKKECTILVLGNDEKTPTPVDCKELTLNTKESKTKDGKAVPAMTIKLLPIDEANGKATKFVGTDPGLGNVADFEGTVLGMINGKASEGTFKE